MMIYIYIRNIIYISIDSIEPNLHELMRIISISDTKLTTKLLHRGKRHKLCEICLKRG